MQSKSSAFAALKSFPGQSNAFYYALSALEDAKVANIGRLPISIRVMLESVLRNCDGKRVKEDDVTRLAKWKARGKNEGEVPFVVSRVLLQDFTGVPLLVDLAAMRDAAAKSGFDAAKIDPLVPVDLIVDHSVQVDRSSTPDAFMFNLKQEFARNKERYSFLKWGQQAFKGFRAVPPGIGICHQVNLEFLGTVVLEKPSEKKGKLLYLDTLVGTDSHTTMINGLGIVGWGVGGIEAQAAMLGQPVTLQMPEVIGVHLTNKLREGVTATDLTLRVTQMLRKENVVDKFVEFFGEGTESLSVADRATIGNMSPEYGATMGFFPVDEKTLEYLKLTGRSDEHIALVKAYLIAQGLFGIPKKGDIDFTKTLELDLASIAPCVAGPKRPQDRIELPDLKDKFLDTLKAPVDKGGYGKTDKTWPTFAFHSKSGTATAAPHGTGGKEELENGTVGWSESEMVANRPFVHSATSPGYSEAEPCHADITHGTVVIAAITSCTNTSNPTVMVAAGLLAKKAVERGLRVNHVVKTSLAPGSRVVTDYLEKAGLTKYLDQLGFSLVGYGCTTCIGNSGPLDDAIEKAVKDQDLVTASVLSGNRNFEARIHASVKANFLMSPPLVVAFAIAGKVNIDLEKEPLGKDKQGKEIFLKDIWPTSQEIADTVSKCVNGKMFRERYAHVVDDSPVWSEIKGVKGNQFPWDEKSTYIQDPPYFEGFSQDIPEQKALKNLTCLALFGDSVTTDHISPAGAFSETSPAGKYLLSLGVKAEDFNSYGSRRGNHNVMMRGTFANVRIKNKMAGGKEGGFTKLVPDGKIVPIFDACETYAKKKTPLIVFAGEDYGMGSSRDWAAKGTLLLGVRAVVARSFERIHRSNLIGMGVLPLEFKKGESHESLGLTGDETFSISGLENGVKPKQMATLEIYKNGKSSKTEVTVRIDTPVEAEYYAHGGIMPFVLRQSLKGKP